MILKVLDENKIIDLVISELEVDIPVDYSIFNVYVVSFG